MTAKIPMMTTVPVMVVGGGLWLCWYMGLFRKITFQKESLGPVKFYHRKGEGPYQSVGPAFQAAITYLQQKGLEDSCSTAGIYYDDPNKVPPGSNPRYAVGFFFQDENTKLQQEFCNDGWELLGISQTNTLASRFPNRMVPISCMISAMKTYRAFRNSGYNLPSTSKDNGHCCGCIEVYEKEEIITHFPQNNAEQFMPPTSSKKYE